MTKANLSAFLLRIKTWVEFQIKTKNFIIINMQKSRYKYIKLLKKYLSVSGKILPRSITRLSAKEQRALKRAIKTARILGLLPVTNR